LTRLPNNLATSPLGKQLYSLLASTSERKYANVYTRTQALVELVGRPDFFDTSLGALLGVMVSAFLGAWLFFPSPSPCEGIMMFEAFGFTQERTLQCRYLSQLPSGL
jgi:hypothetical protein